MALFRHILVPTDYSSASERALETAAALATLCGAELIVVYVIEDEEYPHPFAVPEGAREVERSRLDETVAGLRMRMLRASGLLREGIAWNEICASAAEVSADLVVVGSQGRRGLPRLVLGSVAERIVRLSPVPVLTVHPSTHVAVLAGGMGRFRHILAPTDFSEASQRGTEVAVNLAIDLGTALTLVYVYEVPSYVLGDVAAEVEARLGRDLDGLLARVRARLPKAEGVVIRRAAPWQGILDAAEERRADLIVLSTHGRHGVERTLVGSVAEKVVRLSQVPVLTVGLK